MKTCTHCNKSLPLLDFGGDFKQCAKCREKRSAYSRQWRAEHPEYREQCRVRARMRYAANIENARERSRKYRATHPDKCRESVRRSRVKRLEHYRELSRRYRMEHREERLRKTRERRHAKREAYRETKLKKARERYRRYRTELSDSYLRSLLCNGTDICHADIPQDLVALYREHVKVKRLLRRMRDEEHS